MSFLHASTVGDFPPKLLLRAVGLSLCGGLVQFFRCGDQVLSAVFQQLILSPESPKHAAGDHARVVAGLHVHTAVPNVEHLFWGHVKIFCHF